MTTVIEAIKPLSYAATFAIMFGGALRLKPETLRRAAQNPRLFLRTLFVVWIGVPVITGLVILAVGATGRSAALILLMSVCPGVPILLGTTRTVRGAMATAFLALVLTAATEPLMIPFWTRLMSRYLPLDLSVQPHHVLDVLLPMVFFPIALGFIIRDASDRVTTVLIRASNIVYSIGAIACVVGIAWKGLPLLTEVPIPAILAAMIITVCDVILGFWAGKPKMEDRKAVALAAALGNPALAIAVVEASYPELRASAYVSVYLVIRGTAMVPVEFWLKRQVQKGGA